MRHEQEASVMNQEKAVRKTVIRELPHFWTYSVLSGVISLLIQVIGLVPTVLMQQIIDRFIPDKNGKAIAFFILLFCMIPLLATVLSAFYRYKLAIICRNMG